MKNTRIFTTLFIAGLMFASCENEKKNKMEITSEEVEITNEDKMSNTDQDGEKAVMMREYAMKDGTKITYEYSEDGISSLRDWEDYNTLSYEMGEIKVLDLKVINQRFADLNGTISNLGNSIPAWLKTEEVMEDVSDIQKEYKELIAEKDASEKERKENVEELSEKFDDLREELLETINEYMEINKEAIEEYNEEMKKGKVEAAKEEYAEEIKKKEKIADYKENNK